MKRKLLATLLCLAISVSMVACGNKNNMTEQTEINNTVEDKDSLTESTEINSIVEDSETEEIEVVATETGDMSETIEDDSIVYETDSIEETMKLIDFYGTNGIDNYSILKYQFYTDTIADAGEYYTVKCDIYRPVRVDNGLSIGDVVEITTDETKNEKHTLIYEAENYLIDKDTGVKYYYDPGKDGKKITLFKYEGTYREHTGEACFFIENEVLCKIFTGVIKLSKRAEVIDDDDNITGLITMENIKKSNGWFNQVAFHDGEAILVCEMVLIYGSNRTY